MGFIWTVGTLQWLIKSYFSFCLRWMVSQPCSPGPRRPYTTLTSSRENPFLTHFLKWGSQTFLLLAFGGGLCVLPSVQNYKMQFTNINTNTNKILIPVFQIALSSQDLPMQIPLSAAELIITEVVDTSSVWGQKLQEKPQIIKQWRVFLSYCGNDLLPASTH